MATKAHRDAMVADVAANTSLVQSIKDAWDRMVATYQEITDRLADAIGNEDDDAVEKAHEDLAANNEAMAAIRDAMAVAIVQNTPAQNTEAPATTATGATPSTATAQPTPQNSNPADTTGGAAQNQQAPNTDTSNASMASGAPSVPGVTDSNK